MPPLGIHQTQNPNKNIKAKTGGEKSKRIFHFCIMMVNYHSVG